MNEAQKALQEMIEDRPAVRLLVEVFGLEAEAVAFGAADVETEGTPSASKPKQHTAKKPKQEGQQLALAL